MLLKVYGTGTDLEGAAAVLGASNLMETLKGLKIRIQKNKDQALRKEV